MLNKWILSPMTNRPVKTVALSLALSFAATFTFASNVQAASASDVTKSSYTPEQVSMLGGKLSSKVPAGYAKDPTPLDPKAAAMGVTGASYFNKAEKSLLITAQMPLPVSADSDNDATSLSGLVKGTEMQQSSSYKNYKKIGEKSIVKANGLGIRQLDTSFNVSDKPMLATSVVAASGKQSAIVTVLTSVDNPKGHAALVKTVIGE